MKHFFSDLHLGEHTHESTPVFGRMSTEEWDEMILSNVNRYVKKHDILYIVGDFGSPKKAASYRQKINCKHIVLIMGNHDGSMQSAKRVFGREFVFHQREIKVQGNKVILNHYPMAYWDDSHRGSWHIHGHTHGNREKTILNAFPGWRGIDVGPSSSYKRFGKARPFSEIDICILISGRSGHDNKEWYDSHRGENNEYLFG